MLVPHCRHHHQNKITKYHRIKHEKSADEVKSLIKFHDKVLIISNSSDLLRRNPYCKPYRRLTDISSSIANFLNIGYPVEGNQPVVTQGTPKRFYKKYYNTQKSTMWFEKFLSKLPSVKAQEDEEEELIDPQQVLRDKCNETEHCKALAEKYQTCNDRVNSRSKTTEMCYEELFDWLHAVDHCVTKDLFSKLK